MTNYEITVNSKSYDVTVQKKKAVSTTSVSETKAVAAVAPAPTTTAVSTSGSVGKNIVAPMPGKIMAIKVSVGDSVKKG